MTTWLANRLGEGQLIYATGKTEQQAKYITLPVGTQPNIPAYLQGDPRHIYGSRLATNTTTGVLCFDLDDPVQSSRYATYLSTLTQAGAKPLYWHRQNNRGHLELYFSKPVNAEAAYQWCVSVCPDLAAIPECFPVRHTENRENHPLSFPLYQRRGAQVYECPVSSCMGEDMHTLAGIQSDFQAVVKLIQRAVTPAELIPEPAPAVDGGALLDTQGKGSTGDKKGNQRL